MTETKALVKSKETPKQRGAFLAYFDLGGERSLDKLHQIFTEQAPKTAITLRTLKEWSRKFRWVDKVEVMDIEAADKAEKMAVKKATMKKSQILSFTKNVMIKCNEALLDGTIVPTPNDFRRMWEIYRKEMGLDQAGTDVVPTTVYNVEINQRILNIVKKAEDDAERIIREKIENEPEEK